MVKTYLGTASLMKNQYSTSECYLARISGILFK